MKKTLLVPALAIPFLLASCGQPPAPPAGSNPPTPPSEEKSASNDPGAAVAPETAVPSASATESGYKKADTTTKAS